MHQIEAAVDIVEPHCVSDHRIDLDFSLHIPVHDPGHIRPELAQVIDETPDWIAYDLPDELVPRLWNGCFRGQQQRWFLTRFLGEDREIDIHTDHPEFARWQWMGKADLLDAIVPFKRDVYAQVLRSFDWALD